MSNDDTEWNQLPLDEIEAWAEEAGASAIDHRDRDDKVVCEWGTGDEVHFHADGAIVLRKFRLLGGAEPDATVERCGSRLIVTDSTGEEHRVSATEFPID